MLDLCRKYIKLIAEIPLNTFKFVVDYKLCKNYCREIIPNTLWYLNTELIHEVFVSALVGTVCTVLMSELKIFSNSAIIFSGHMGQFAPREIILPPELGLSDELTISQQLKCCPLYSSCQIYNFTMITS